MEWWELASALLFHIRQTTDITVTTTTTTVMTDMMRSMITTVAVTRSEGGSGEMMRVEESVVMVPLKTNTQGNT